MKTVIQIVLWVVIVILGYFVYHSIEEPIQFEKVKKERYLPVIHRLNDIRTLEIAYKDVNGRYSGSFKQLERFVDSGQFVITQSRDTSYLDKEYKRTYGVDHYIQDVIIDTLDFVNVHDSLFKGSDRYRYLKFVPGTDKKVQFELKADSIKQGDTYIPVFRVRVDKKVLLKDQNPHLVDNERKLQAVDDVSGKYIQVGSLNKVNDSGNWPKDYGKKGNDN